MKGIKEMKINKMFEELQNYANESQNILYVENKGKITDILLANTTPNTSTTTSLFCKMIDDINSQTMQLNHMISFELYDCCKYLAKSLDRKYQNMLLMLDCGVVRRLAPGCEEDAVECTIDAKTALCKQKEMGKNHCKELTKMKA